MNFNIYFLITFVYLIFLALSVWYLLLLSRFGAIKLPRKIPYTELQQSFDGKIAVVIPCRNEEDNITTVLESMMNQSFSNFTVVVTDRSSDNTLGVAQEFYNLNKSKFDEKKIKLILLAWDEKKNFQKGRIGQFNHAFSILSKEIEYIGYADADGQYLTDWLFALTYGISKGFDLVSSGFILANKKRLLDQMDNLDNQFVVISGQSSMKSGIRGWMFGASALYNRNSFNDIKGYEGIEHITMDDFALANKFFTAKKKVGYFNDRRALVSVAPVSSQVTQKIRWSSANWAESNLTSKIVILTSNLFPLLLYMLGIIAGIVSVLPNSSDNILSIPLTSFELISLIMLVLDLSVVSYLIIKTRVNPIMLPIYLAWINFVSRPIVIYSFFKRQVNWKQENIIIDKMSSTNN